MSANVTKMPKSGKAISPSKANKISPKNTINLLHDRLENAENETKNLNEFLENMGLPSRDTALEPVKLSSSPFKCRGEVTDDNALVKNYEVLVSRTCRLESTIQSLKLNLCALQAEKNFQKKDTSNTNEKLIIALEAYDREIRKIKRTLEELRSDKKSLADELTHSRKSVTELKSEILEAKSAKDSALVKEEELTNSKVKLNKRVTEVKCELERENKLRLTLEESHNGLLSTSQHLQSQLQTQQQQISSLTADNSSMKTELTQLQDEIKAEKDVRCKSDHLLKQTQQQLDQEMLVVTSLQDEKSSLVGEVGKVKCLYKDLNEDLQILQTKMEQKHKTFTDLETENEQLKWTLTTSLHEHQHAVTDYEEKLKVERDEFNKKFECQDLVIELRERLRKEIKDLDSLQKDRDDLHQSVSELECEVDTSRAEMDAYRTEMERKAARLEEKVKFLQEEKNKNQKDKQSLIAEASETADKMAEQEAEMTSQLEQYKMDMSLLNNNITHLESDNSRLVEKVQSLETKQSGRQNVDLMLNEMLEQKNVLSYDKGRLETRVDQLQRELESMANLQCELLQLRKYKQTMEARFAKAQSDIQTYKLSQTQNAARIKQLTQDNERKERDFILAIQSRDAALNEAQKFKSYSADKEERGKNQMSVLQLNLSESRHESEKLAETLKCVVQSHGSLQTSIENVQLQMGRKDAEILQLRNEKEKNVSVLDSMTSQLNETNEKLALMEAFQVKEVEPLLAALEESRAHNKKLTNERSSVSEHSSQLQRNVNQLENSLQQQTFLTEQQKVARQSDQEESRRLSRNYEERIKCLKETMKKEREKAICKTYKENTELKSVVDELTKREAQKAKLADQVVRSDRWFKQKVLSLQQELKEVETRYAQEATDQSRALYDEKAKAKLISEEAEMMLKENRAVTSRLVEAAEMNKEESLTDLEEVYHELSVERDESRRKDDVIRRLKASSLRQVEDLARSLTPDGGHVTPSPRTSSPFFVDDMD